jgi:hypothetical protein
VTTGALRIHDLIPLPLAHLHAHRRLSLHARQFLPTGGKARREPFAAHLPARLNSLSGKTQGTAPEALVDLVYGPHQRFLPWSIYRLK